MNTRIFTHGDADGLCAGAIALAAHHSAKVYFTHPHGLLEDLTAVRAGDTVIICDVSLSETDLTQILSRFSEIAEKGDLTYIDHHPLSGNLSKERLSGRIVHRLDSSAAELTYSTYHSNIDPVYARIAIYGAIGDYLDDTPQIRRLLERWDKRTLYFESGILVQGIEGQKKGYELKRRIISTLANNLPPSSDRQLVELAVRNTHEEEVARQQLRNKIHMKREVAYVLNFPFSLGKTATYARGMTNALVGVAGEERKDMIDMSLRSCNPQIDLNKLLRLIAPEHEGSGGGHPAAAGARIPKENFERFLNDLSQKVSLNQRP